MGVLVVKNIISRLKLMNKTQIFKNLKKNWINVVIISLCLFFSIGYIVGTTVNSRDNLLSKLEVALKNNDVTLLSTLVQLNGKRIDKELLEPIMEYYNADSKRVDTTISRLKTKYETSDMKLESRKFLFWNKSYINMKTYNIKIKSNFDKAIFTVNEFDPITADGELGDILPGIYKIEGNLDSEYGEVKNNSKILLTNDVVITLNLPAKNIVVDSQFTDAEIYINNKNTGFIVKDKKEIGPLPIDGTITMHLEKDFPWGRIKGEKVKVSSNPSMRLDINMENDKLKAEIKDIITNYYNGVFQALNEENKALISNSTEEAQDKMYKILEEKYFFLKNKYIINEINIIEENNEYCYKDGQFRAIIVVDINYEISKLLGINKSSNSKSFFTRLLYVDGNWKVENVENFSL